MMAFVESLSLLLVIGAWETDPLSALQPYLHVVAQNHPFNTQITCHFPGPKPLLASCHLQGTVYLPGTPTAISLVYATFSLP